MRDGLVETKLGQYIHINTGKLDVNAASEFGEYPFFTCSKETYRIDEAAFEGESVLVAGNGDLNVKYYDGKFNAYQRTYVLNSIDRSILDNQFLFLYMQSYIEYLRSETRGTVIQYLKKGQFTDAKIKLPPLPEQKRIVDLISSVDSYIEALQQQQNFAKQMLQALSQKTFLAQGDFVQLHTVATCIMGQSPEGATCNKDGIGTPLLTGPTEFQKNNWVGPPRQWTTNETKISISQDILFCVRGATAGRMNLTNYRSVIGRGLAAIRCEDPLDTHFVRFALQFGLNQLLPAAGGTIFPNISQSQLRNFKLPWPSETERRSLANLLKSVEDNAGTLSQNIIATKNLRFSLLNALLTGEHEIPASYDKVMGAA